jgi:DNA-binding transcriptional MerR regulator
VYIEQKVRVYKIGEVAELLETTPRTLRFYEEQGMLVPFRSDKGTRLYCEDDIARLRVILHLVRLDVPLRTIHELVVARLQSHNGDEASHKVFDLLSELCREVEKKKGECEDALEQITVALQSVKQCFGCNTVPTAQGCKHCLIKEHINRSRLFHLIWDKENSTS